MSGFFSGIVLTLIILTLICAASSLALNIYIATRRDE
jgi:hypothetical protein